MKHKENRWKKGALKKTGDQGFALLVVIVLMLLISFLASQLMLQVREELKIAFNAKKRAIEYFLSEAGVNLALFRLLDRPGLTDPEEYEMFYEGYVYEETALSKGKIQYYVVSESGKIDLNRSPRALLEMFLEYHDLEPEERAVVLDSLEDWRDTDNFHRMNGAERETYNELEVPYEPRNGLIEDPAELLLIYGTRNLSGKFRPEDVFTVKNPSGRINFNSLSPELLDFLVEGDEEKKQLYQETKEIKERLGLDAADARYILGDERFDLVSNYLVFSSANKFYTVVSSAEAIFNHDPEAEDTAEKIPATRISLLIEKNGQNYKRLSWKESQT